ncbi:MAG: hypothetical protein K2X62_00625 [Beijerinckiaceae bacterium]|nr:hypothetical protein [Beijerinckiaceae bacterium]MDO9440010.1 hypothetical protein [Beijerinckiaceae bacterium]
MPFWLEAYILFDAICLCGFLLVVSNSAEVACPDDVTMGPSARPSA